MVAAAYCYFFFEEETVPLLDGTSLDLVKCSCYFEAVFAALVLTF